MSTATATVALESATPELREKLHRCLERIEGPNTIRSSSPAVRKFIGDERSPSSRKPSSSTGGTPGTGGTSGTIDADRSDTDSSGFEEHEEDEEPLDYFMLEVASKLEPAQAAALMDRIRRYEQRQARTEDRLRKKLKRRASSASENAETAESASDAASPAKESTEGHEVPQPHAVQSCEKESCQSPVPSPEVRRTGACASLVRRFLCIMVFILLALNSYHSDAVIGLSSSLHEAAGALASMPMKHIQHMSTSVHTLAAMHTIAQAAENASAAAAAAQHAAAKAQAAAGSISEATDVVKARHSADGSVCRNSERQDDDSSSGRTSISAPATTGALEPVPAQQLSQNALGHAAPAAESSPGGKAELARAFAAEAHSLATHGGVVQSEIPESTEEGRARELAAELAMKMAMQQQVNRAMQVAAERLAAKDAPQHSPVSPPTNDPAKRRAELREHVRVMEERNQKQQSYSDTVQGTADATKPATDVAGDSQPNSSATPDVLKPNGDTPSDGINLSVALLMLLLVLILLDFVMSCACSSRGKVASYSGEMYKHSDSSATSTHAAPTAAQSSEASRAAHAAKAAADAASAAARAAALAAAEADAAAGAAAAATASIGR